VYFVPSPGTYFFVFKGRLVLLTRERSDQPSTMWGGYTRVRESFWIRIFTRRRSLAQELLDACKETAIPRDGKIDVRVIDDGSWELGARVRPRPLDSVILDGDQAEFLLRDMSSFLR